MFNLKKILWFPLFYPLGIYFYHITIRQFFPQSLSTFDVISYNLINKTAADIAVKTIGRRVVNFSTYVIPFESKTKVLLGMQEWKVEQNGPLQ